MSVDNKAYTNNNKYNSYPVGSEVECKAVPFSFVCSCIGYSPIQRIAPPAYHKAEKHLSTDNRAAKWAKTKAVNIITLPKVRSL